MNQYVLLGLAISFLLSTACLVKLLLLARRERRQDEKYVEALHRERDWQIYGEFGKLPAPAPSAWKKGDEYQEAPNPKDVAPLRKAPPAPPVEYPWDGLGTGRLPARTRSCAYCGSRVENVWDVCEKCGAPL